MLNERYYLVFHDRILAFFFLIFQQPTKDYRSTHSSLVVTECWHYRWFSFPLYLWTPPFSTMSICHISREKNRKSKKMKLIFPPEHREQSSNLKVFKSSRVLVEKHSGSSDLGGCGVWGQLRVCISNESHVIAEQTCWHFESHQSIKYKVIQIPTIQSYEMVMVTRQGSISNVSYWIINMFGIPARKGGIKTELYLKYSALLEVLVF